MEQACRSKEDKLYTLQPTHSIRQPSKQHVPSTPCSIIAEDDQPVTDHSTQSKAVTELPGAKYRTALLWQEYGRATSRAPLVTDITLNTKVLTAHFQDAEFQLHSDRPNNNASCGGPAKCRARNKEVPLSQSLPLTPRPRCHRMSAHRKESRSTPLRYTM